MNKSSRRTLLLILSVFLAAWLCSFCLAGFSALELLVSNFSLAATKTTTTNSPGGIDPKIVTQMERIESQVIEMRGLQPSSEVKRVLYTPEDLRRRVMDDFFADYTPEEAAQDTLVLSIFGLVPPDIDLLKLYIDLYSEGIAGFYDSDNEEMAIVGESGFTGLEQLTYAHEYTHALQDQNYDLSDGLGYNDTTCEQDSERCLALQALIEGDATLAESAWFGDYAGEKQRREVMDFYDDYQSPVFDSAPPFLQQDMLYAYTAGYLFVQYLYDHGGWPAVDAAYADPPLTTEHILHPELYPQELPIPVSLPDLTALLGEEWRLLEEDTLGEWYTFMLLGYPVDRAAALSEYGARQAAAGWGGDRYAVYRHEDGSHSLLVVRHVWDTAADAAEFDRAFRQYAGARFSEPIEEHPGRVLWSDPQGFHMLFRSGNETVWIFAPDQETAQSIYDHIEEAG